ncbi:endonuclease/exonuclease/phosphatase family protein [Halobellus sp. GM3]|uniref:endonuclease/exonuclease/phosphatase family protein n=1 Tax=Halobellus sp. GM3 TaxID=3458410 RepID=UPI00403D718C
MDETSISRRRLFRTGGRALAGASLLHSGAGTVAANGDDGTADAEPPDVVADGLTVATQNLGLGADLLSVARSDTDAPIPERVGALYDDVRAGRPRARMAAVADALAAVRPAVVGVQEAAIVRRGPRSGGDPEKPDAGEVVVDFLAALREALDARDAPYTPEAVATNADLEFPARVDGDPVDVRLTDRDAILVREDGELEVAETQTAGYDEALSLPIGPGRSVEIERGYARATLRVGDGAVTVVNTHLEAGLESVRTAQATELSEALAAVSEPVVLLGDLNGGPDRTGTSDESETGRENAYGILTESLSDAVGSEIGGTCCRPSSFRSSEENGLTRRIDHVLVRGRELTGTDSRRLGVETFTTADGTELWPSDHTGVFVELAAEPDESVTEEPSESVSNRTMTTESTGPTETTGGADTAGSERPSTANEIPGFGVGTGLTALVGVTVGAGIRRWLRQRERR